MTVIPGTAFYTATVDVFERKPGVIEYYINVRDSDNNKVTKGFAFDPLIRVLEAPESPVTSAEPTVAPTATTQPAAPAPTGRSTGRTLLYVGLAVLAVGALAAAASGGGGGSSDGSPTTPGGPTIPVTITVDTIASGF